MKGRISKKIISSILSLVLCTTAIPMVPLTSSAANSVKPKIATGQNHTVVLKSDGSVWSVGRNEDGKLGVGKTQKELPQTATFMQCIDNKGAEIKDAFDIACGYYHTAVLRRSGELWQCGYNEYGQLGIADIGSSIGETKFVQSKDSNNKVIENATAVSCNQHITAIIRGDGELWMCGYSANGQLGTGNKTEVTKFVQSKDSSGAITNAKAVACGSTHTAVIRGDGELWQCGINGNGQLGNGESGTDTDGNDLISTTFVQSKDSSGLITNAKAVACGASHTAVIRGNGELWQCGYNEYGQLGTGDTNDASKFVQSKDSSGEGITNAESISCDSWVTAVIRNSGELWMCGNNEYGQLGTGESGDDVKSTLFVQSQKSNSNAINGARAVVAGYHHTLILIPGDDEGLELYGVGENTNGQFGLGEDSDDAYEDQVRFIKSAVISLGKDPNWNRLNAIGAISSRNVTGTGEFVNVIDVEITWGALTYNYNATWNSAEQKWNEGDWKPSGNNADMIEVTNNSSAAYNVSLAFTVDNAYAASSASGTAIEGSFFRKDSSSGKEMKTDLTDNTLKLTTTAEAKKDTVYLRLTGMSDKITGLENDLTDKTVGTVTATLQNPTTT